MIFALVVALAPTPAPTAAGPCSQGALAMISDRPGIGRAPASNGAACVVPPRAVVVEAGYRNQVTTGPATQTLSVYPNPVVRIGLGLHNEVLVSHGFIYSQRNGAQHVTVNGLLPASGQQDAGVGFKHLLRDKTNVQDAINLFVTAPTGYPAGPNGFSAGLPTYTLGYSLVFNVSSRIGVSTTQNFISNAAPLTSGSSARFFTYQAAVSGSYALSANLTLLLQDQLSFSAAPAAGSGNRALVGLQDSISPNVVLDLDFETNLLPQPGVNQHAVDAGITILP